jgi:hypothetical protein
MLSASWRIGTPNHALASRIYALHSGIDPPRVPPNVMLNLFQHPIMYSRHAFTPMHSGIDPPRVPPMSC